ncbi:phage tail tape measure protein, partial [Paracoccus sp. DMF]|nr:phage tail tape measure protein [Paracoccus sp. DMF]
MQSAIESVVGFGNTAANTFEGAYEAIKAIWGLLPAAIGDLAFQAANSLVDGVEAMLNGVVSRINGFIGGINQGLEALGSERRISLVPDLDLGEIENRFEGAASAATTAAQAAFDRAFEDNPLSAPDLGLSEAANRALESANLYRGAARDLAEGARAPLESWQALRDVVRGTDEASADALT